MEVRKIVRSGYSSHVIALPKEWLLSNKLSKGDKVIIEETDDHNLLITTELEKATEIEEVEKTLDITGLSPYSITREIISHYTSDCTLLTIKGDNILKNRDVIKKTIVNLVAFEIIEESSNEIIAKSYLDISTSNVLSILRRMDNILKAMLLDMMQCFGSMEMSAIIDERFEETERMGYLINKIIYNTYRNKALARKIKLTSMKMGLYSQINARLIKLCQKCSLIGKNFARMEKINMDKDILKKNIDNLLSLHKDVMKAFFTKDMKLADDVSQRIEPFLEKCHEMIENAENNTVFWLFSNIKAFTSHTEDISRIIRYTMHDIK